jgi:hypothetical protein
MEACQKPVVSRWAAVDQQPRHVVEHTGPKQAAQEGPFHEDHVMLAEFSPTGEDAVGHCSASPSRAGLDAHRHVLDTLDGISSISWANEGHVVPSLGQSLGKGHLGGGAEVPAKVSNADPKNPHGGSPFQAST